MKLRLPDAMNSENELLQVYNLDLEELTPSELIGEMYRAARIVARDPRAFVWRATIPITPREWADERINVCRELLRRRTLPSKTSPKGTVRAWTR